MENKKQLIIIAPMSEALKKLNEVLEGISTDENMEITIIDDLKELSQFLATTGQSLILSSNAKKCAQFLQENRFVIAKSHAKVILFTPKEIPIKTLVKFTKLGLTENILENSPPKTFLYKVKLLLRSIKSVKTTEEKDRDVIRSLTEKKPQIDEEISLEKELHKTEKISEDFGSLKGKIKTEENVIDYSSNMKGKIRPQDETIDTHWKSDRKADVNIDLGSKENMRTESGEQESIDMYYRSKRKKTEAVTEELDAFGRFKKPKTIEDETPEEKERNSIADVIDDGVMKEKRLKQLDNDDEEDSTKEKNSEFDLITTKKKKDFNPEELEDELDLMRTKNKKQEDTTSPEDAELDDTMKEDLGGHLKGKVKEQFQEEAEEEYVDKKTYDNSDAGSDDSENIDLELITGAKKKKRIEDEESLEDNIHDGVVDHIEGDMIGDAGTVEKIRTRMHGKSDSIQSEEDELDALIESLRKKAQEKNDEEESSASDELPPEDEKEEKTKKKIYTSEEDTKDYTPSLEHEIELEASEKKAKPASAVEKTLKEQRDSDNDALGSGEKNHERAKGYDLEEEKGFGFKKLDDPNAQDKRENAIHDGKADKIDTYMRGGNAKKSEHNWDNLTEKNDTTLAAAKAKRAADGLSAKADKAIGEETTIDYRKLKEEFDQIARTNLRSSETQSRDSVDTNLKYNDDNGSFQVVEIDPKCLDFSINIQNAIYQKDIKAKQIFKMIAVELFEKYKAAGIFYTYKLSSKTFSEVFNIVTEPGLSISDIYKDKWTEFKNDSELVTHIEGVSMTTWRCPEIINDGVVWEDVELPSWAAQELTTKSVELIFPYFDGLDRMGLVVVFLPEGIKPQEAGSLLVSLELARTLFLDTIERYNVVPLKEVIEGPKEAAAPVAAETKNITAFISGLFGRKKTG